MSRRRRAAYRFKPAVQPVSSVSGDASDGSELIRKRPSGATSYWKPERDAAMMRVWNNVRGAPTRPVYPLKCTPINFLSGAI